MGEAGASRFVQVLERVETHGDVERFHMTRATLGRAWLWVSVYHVDGVLVDGGSHVGRAAMGSWLAKRATHAALATHEHEDHVANFDLLPPGTPVHAPPLTARFLREGTPPFPIYRQLYWGYPRLKGLDPTLVGERVATATRAFRVVDAKGHSMDQVAYLDEASGALFTGDAWMGKMRAARLAEDVATGVATLRRLAELDANVMFPAHGPIVERPRKKLLDTAEYFDDLRRRAHKLRDEGRDEKRIARELFGRDGGITYVSAGEFSHANMVRNLLRTPPP